MTDALSGRVADRLSVVPVDESNWRAYRDVRLTMLREAPRAFWTTYDEAATRTDEQWREMATSAQVWLALRDGDPVGSAGCFQAPGQPAEDCVLVGMWVDPSARGQGVGERLVRVVVGYAAARGRRRVLLEVAHENAAAVALYERIGFVPTGRTGAMPHDPSITELEMELVLGDSTATPA